LSNNTQSSITASLRNNCWYQLGVYKTLPKSAVIWCTPSLTVSVN